MINSFECHSECHQGVAAARNPPHFGATEPLAVLSSKYLKTRVSIIN